VVLSSVFHLIEDASALPSTAVDATAEILRILEQRKAERATRQEKAFEDTMQVEAVENTAIAKSSGVKQETVQPPQPKISAVHMKPTEEEVRRSKLRRVGTPRDAPAAPQEKALPAPALVPPILAPAAKWGIKLKPKLRPKPKLSPKPRLMPKLRGSVANMEADAGLGLNIVFSVLFWNLSYLEICVGFGLGYKCQDLTIQAIWGNMCVRCDLGYKYMSLLFYKHLEALHFLES